MKEIEVALDIVGYFSEANVKVQLSTPLERAVRFFDMDREVVHSKFGNYGIAANFDLRRKLGYWDVTGALQLDVRGDWIDQVDVGFHLSDEILNYDKKKLTPLIQESVSHGVFKAKNISCELFRILKHFSGGDWDLEGMLSVDGVFSPKSIDLEVESSYLNLMTTGVDVRLNSVLDADTLESSEGKFHYDIETNHLSAYFPLYNSVIMEKGLGLIFSDTKADLYYDGQRLRMEDVSCETDGLLVEGDVDLLFSPGKALELRVETQEISGTAENLESFLKNIKGLKDVKLPFDGRVLSDEDGLILTMKFHKDAPLDINWEANFSLLHGSMPLVGDYALRDLRFDFSSQSQDNKMQCTNLCGKLGKGENESEYVLSAREIEVDYTDINGIDGCFDIRLENTMMDLVRFVGGYDGKQKKLYFEEDLSHVFGSKLNGIKLDLSDENTVKELDCSFNFSVEEIALGMRVAQDLGIDQGISDLIQTQMKALSGNIEGRLALNKDLWTLGLDSNDLSHLNMQHVPLSIKIEREKNIFKVENAQFGQMSIKGALLKEEDGYTVDDLEVSLEGETITFEKGGWNSDEKICRIPLLSGKVNLAKFLQWGPNLLLDGVFEFSMASPVSEPGVTSYKTALSGSGFPFSACYKGEVIANDLGKENLAIASMSPVHIEYSQERGFLIKDSDFCLEDGEFNIALRVPTLVFLTDEKICQGYRIKTRLTPDLVQYLALQFPFGDEIKKTSFLSENGASPELVFDFEYAKEKMQVGGVLPKGRYHWNGKKYDLADINFHFSERLAEISGGIDLLGKNFGVHIKSYPYNQFDTIVEVLQLEVDEESVRGEKQALYVECKLKDEDGLSLQKIEGNIYGLNFNFVPKIETGFQGEGSSFLGSVKLDMEEMRPLLNSDMIEIIDELELKRGYELSGELTFEKAHFKKPIFNGFFKARDFDLLGFQFQTCFSTIRIDENGADIHDIKVSDDAITVDLKEIKMHTDKDGKMALVAPEMLIRDLRPSLLQKRGKMRGRIKPFHIKNMVFNDINGKLCDPKTLKGKGHLNFVNTFKEGTNLLDIPIEIISRLGLDIGLLVPIQGEMDYVLKDGKLIFNKLKNSYSDNKRSYFFLWNKTESYVDLDGNIHIDIRMKAVCAL